ncbi:hypothetical protein SNE35_24700 [Paucibacter sp. R3-3]|uniref:Uncharacterized protein n=1 Tax=Roseateles agri TaxID=3098619 RepID=A0ABU5DN42_9BURK|nr:hypothetical protein [Paucibacter sp. R3-3]MDY0747726.1 hypothetical protein [Paucibacter sp. R3-3]
MNDARAPASTDRRAICVALLAAVCAPSRAAAPASGVADIQTEVQGIVSRFMTRASSVLPGVPAPRIVISFTPQLSWIADDGSAIHTVAWSQCPPGMQGFFAGLLGDAPPMSAPEFFHEVFNAFLVPHEMSHFVDARRGHLKNGGDFYGGEVHANRVAVAFWLGEPGGGERMARLMDAVTQAHGRMSSPVPAGQEKATYFNENYQALLDDASKYGWYQFRMFLDAWDQRNAAGFDTLLRTPLA